MITQKIKVSLPALFLLAGATLAGPGPDWESLNRLREGGKLAQALDLLRSWRHETFPLPEQLKAVRMEYGLLYDLKRYSEAEEAGRRWINLASKAGSRKEEAEAYHSIGRSFHARRLPKEAASYFHKALEILTSLGGGPLELPLLIDLADTETALSNYPAAQGLLDRAKRLWEQKQDARLGARLWMCQGTVKVDQGEAAEALPHLQTARDFARQAKSGHLLAAVLTNLARVYIQIHAYAEALPVLREALAADPASPLRALTLANIGICHFELNQMEEAARTFEEVRQAAIVLGSPRVEAWALGELGLVEQKWRKDFQRAIAYYDQAVDLFRRTGDSRNELVFLQNKTTVFRDEGRYQKALALYRQIETRMRQIPGQQIRANVYQGLGQCLMGLGRYQEAEELLKQAVQQAGATEDAKTVWQSHRELARLYRKTDRLSQADRAYQQALDAIEGLRRSLRLPTFKADFFQDKIEVYEEYAEFLLSNFKNGTARAFAVAERSRARSFLDSLAESRIVATETLPPAIIEREKALLAKISGLQAKVRQKGETQESAAALEEQEKELDDFYLRVRAEYPRFRELRYPESAGLDEIQRILQPGEAIFKYWLAEKKSHLWVVTAKQVHYFPLAGKKELDSLLRQAYTGLMNPKEAPSDLAALSQQLLPASLTQLQDPPDLIFIVPSGLLYYFPFAVLPVKQKALAEISATTYLPSASTLVYLRRLSGQNPDKRLLALGAPVYRGLQNSERASLMGLQTLGALPHTEKEVRSLRSLFGRRASTLLVAESATEATFKKQELSRYSVIHLAAHGWIDSNSPSRSGIVLGFAPGEAEDGILQVREIARLSLAARLVTLSACQSALGELVTGEGMVGLVRAFFYAGAESLVASLWNVNDEATAEFMSGFYRFLREGSSTAEALRRAGLELRNDPRYRHPYFWAPYILVGRGSDVIEFPRRWEQPVILALLAVVAGTFLWFRLRARRRAR